MNTTTDHLNFPFGFHNVRVILRSGEPWFVAADVLSTLTLDRKALERLDDDEKGVSSIRTPGGPQDLTVINEAGLYTLIMRSTKPEAKRFKRWVTHEVLPTIRRTGGYGARVSPASLRDLSAHKQAAQLLREIGSTRKRAVQQSLYEHLVSYRQALGLDTPPLAALCDLEPPQPPAVAAFWAVVGRLHALGVPINHSRDPALLAISFPELQALAATHGLTLPTKLECRAITHGAEPRYLGARVVNSALTRLPKWAWVFRAGEPAQPETAAQQMALALPADGGGARCSSQQRPDGDKQWKQDRLPLH